MKQSISITIPTKNRQSLLEAALASVDSQTQKVLKTFVIDDGSEPKVHLKNIKNDNSTTLYRNEKSCGAFHAKNKGAESSNSDLIAFLDDDDLLDEKYIEEVTNAFEKFPQLDVIFMGVHFFSEDKEIDQSKYEGFLERIIEQCETETLDPDLILFKSGLTKALILTGVPMAFQRPVSKRRVFEKIGGYKTLDYWDPEWAIRASTSNVQIGLIKKGLYLQRIGSQQLYSKNKNETDIRRAVEMKRLLFQSADKGSSDKALFRHALARALSGSAYFKGQQKNLKAALTEFFESQRLERNLKDWKMLFGFIKALFSK